MESSTLTAAIDQQLAAVKAQRDQHIADANACNGAIQQLEWMLATITKSAAESEPALPDVQA